MKSFRLFTLSLFVSILSSMLLISCGQTPTQWEPTATPEEITSIGQEAVSMIAPVPIMEVNTAMAPAPEFESVAGSMPPIPTAPLPVL